MHSIKNTSIKILAAAYTHEGKIYLEGNKLMYLNGPDFEWLPTSDSDEYSAIYELLQRGYLLQERNITRSIKAYKLTPHGENFYKQFKQ